MHPKDHTSHLPLKFIYLVCTNRFEFKNLIKVGETYIMAIQHKLLYLIHRYFQQFLQIRNQQFYKYFNYESRSKK